MSPADGADDAEVAEAAEQLYALPPGEFTAARDGLVREAKDAGDRALAAALQAFKRPTVAAWAVRLHEFEDARQIVLGRLRRLRR